MFQKTPEAQGNRQVITLCRRAYTLNNILLAIIGLAASVPPLQAQPIPYPQDIEVVRKLLDINGLTDVSVSAVSQITISPLGKERVGEIKLSNKQVTQVPPEIGKLEWLRSLKLPGCQITELPGEIGQCILLEELWLMGNRLTTLPPELALCTSLKSITLNGNPFESFPAEIGRIPIITHLAISNAPKGIPRGIGYLRHLKQLDLSGNQISIVPEEIGALAALEELDLSNNNIKALPDSFGQTLHRFSRGA